MLWMSPGHGTTWYVHWWHTENIQNMTNQSISVRDQCMHISINTCNKTQPLSLLLCEVRLSFSFFQEISPHLNPWFHMIYMGMLGIIIAFLFAAWQHTGYNLVLTHSHTHTADGGGGGGNWTRVSGKQTKFQTVKENLWDVWSSSQEPQRLTFQRSYRIFGLFNFK